MASFLGLLLLFFLVVLLIAPVFFLLRLQKSHSSHLSLQHMAEIVKRSFDSFPCVYVVTLLSAAVSLACIWSTEDYKDLYQLHSTLQWGVSVSFALYAFGVSPQRKKLIPLVVIGILAFVFFSQRAQPIPVMVMRWAQFSLLSHLIISFAPFIRSGSEMSFWSYNKNLLFTFLVSTIYSLVILVGLMIALGGVEFLFEVQHPDFSKLYLCMVVLCTFIIHPTIFLGIVESKHILKGNADQENLSALRTFSTYVLYPLIFLYLAILLGYEGKILYAMVLPKGTVSWLVCSFGVAGVLTWLITYPLGLDGKGSAGFFHKRFFYLFMPLLGLIAVGVWVRVSEYGLTESRYSLIVLTAWISIITVRFAFRPRTSIKVIPISLFLLTLVTTFGYLSASNISYRSQLSRLERSLFKGGECKMFPNEAFSPGERRDIIGIIDYLFERHHAATQTYLGERCKNDANISDAISKISSFISTTRFSYYYSPERSALLASLGIATDNPYQNTTKSDPFFSYSSPSIKGARGWNVEGLTNFFAGVYVTSSPSSDSNILFLKNNATVKVSLEKTSLKFAFSTGEILVLDLSSRLALLEDQSKGSKVHVEAKEGELDFEITEQGKTIRLFLTDLEGRKRESGYEIDVVRGAFGFNVGETRPRSQTQGVE